MYLLLPPLALWLASRPHLRPLSMWTGLAVMTAGLLGAAFANSVRCLGCSSYERASSRCRPGCSSSLKAQCMVLAEVSRASGICSDWSSYAVLSSNIVHVSCFCGRQEIQKQSTDQSGLNGGCIDEAFHPASCSLEPVR
jgi:hypothetical protein